MLYTKTVFESWLATNANRPEGCTVTEELRRHFNEQEIVEITWVNALENYYNLLNVALEIESDGFCALAQGKTA